MNHQIIARDLITPSEVGLLKTDECLLFLRGVKPFKSKKFTLEKHKRYKLLSDYDEKIYLTLNIAYMILLIRVGLNQQRKYMN